MIFENGGIRVENADHFESRFKKVVPLPPRNLDKPSLENFERTHRVENGKLVALSPEEIAALPPVQAAPELTIVEAATQAASRDVIGSQSTLRPKVEIAYEMLLDADSSAGLKVLRKALADETDWCNCAPGSCIGGPRWGCRENSPLVKP